VLAELEQLAPDLTVFGGDVAAGPLPCETIARLRALDGARFVRGNADRMMAAGTEEGLAAWAAKQLDDEHREFLRSFEPSIVLDGVLYCHATPSDDEPFVTVLTPDDLARETIGDVEQDVVVIGHTHSQFDRRLGDLRLVNAGSVGMPYEDAPGAYWALLSDGEPEFRRTQYDLDAAADRIRSSGWPMADRWIEDNLRNVPSAREAAEFFESQRG
jgi:diadenosine tetraphosphatase ApaH/serine/threonine PP2A family protein phosphatase